VWRCGAGERGGRVIDVSSTESGWRMPHCPLHGCIVQNGVTRYCCPRKKNGIWAGTFMNMSVSSRDGVSRNHNSPIQKIDVRVVPSEIQTYKVNVVLYQGFKKV